MKNIFLTLCLIAQLAPHFLFISVTATEHENENTVVYDEKRGIATTIYLNNPPENNNVFSGETNTATSRSFACAGGSGMGSGDFKSLEFTGCDYRHCNLVIDTSYSGSMYFSSYKNESEIIMNITAVAVSPSSNPTYFIAQSRYPLRNYTHNKEYPFTFNLKFFTGQYAHKTGAYNLKFELYSPHHGGVIICRTLPINLNATLSNGNDGVSLGVPCNAPDEPCAFKHSLCVRNTTQGWSSNSCQCDWAAFYEQGRGCQKTIGTSCQSSQDCIKQAECVRVAGENYGLCECIKDYTSSSDDRAHCNSGSSSLLFPIFLFITTHLVVFVFWRQRL